jgi:hypothetical protein
MPDLDQGGITYQNVRTYLGPSLGWVQNQVLAQQYLTVGGNFTWPPGLQTLLVNVAANVTIFLPTVSLWLREPFYQPATAFDRSIWIKDYGGNAGAFNITIASAGGNTIDGLATFTIIQNFAMMKLYPLNDLTGWFNG